MPYCYIDYQEGISFREFGLYKEDGIETNEKQIVVSRYTDNLELGFFDSPTEEMENFAKDINEHTPEFKSFLDHCLETDPKKRSSAKDLLKHEFIKKFVVFACFFY